MFEPSCNVAKAVLPSCATAHDASSDWTHVTWPFSTAMSSAVLPSLGIDAVTSASRASRRCMHALCPFFAVSISAVQPLSSRASLRRWRSLQSVRSDASSLSPADEGCVTCALISQAVHSNRTIHASNPASAATIRAVFPCSSRSSASAPASTSSVTHGSCPCRTASISTPLIGASGEAGTHASRSLASRSSTHSW